MIPEATLLVASLLLYQAAPGGFDRPPTDRAVGASAETGKSTSTDPATVIPPDADQPSSSSSSSDRGQKPVPQPENVIPVSRSVDVSVPEPTVDWRRLRNGTALFIGAQHTFRFVTEEGTRQGLKGPFFTGWAESAGALHGWSDGDPFLVNYIGHPMQGAVASYIWIASDPAYRGAEFGKNRRYWMSRLRATTFSFLYSSQFEIGAVSEASLGNVQYLYPQQGMVDHVITPVVGFGWTILEDVLDRYVVKRVEASTYNPLLRALARGGLNPARTWGQMMAFRNPLGRDDRPTLYRYDPKTFVPTPVVSTRPIQDVPGVAPIEFTPRFTTEYFTGSRGGGLCLGGGAAAAFRLTHTIQAVIDVTGCGLMNPARGLSGDVLTYMAGPRWTPATERWQPHLQVLIGGSKISHERADKPQVSGEPSQVDDVNGFAVGAGAGLSYKLNRALAVDVATIEYRRSLVSPLNGFDYRNSLRVTTGLTLRIGTW